MSKNDHSIQISEIFEEDLVGEQVSLRGWVYRKRSSGNLVFLIVRDGTGMIQTVIHKDNVSEKTFEEGDRISIESSLKMSGVVREDKRAPEGYEISVNDLEIVGLAKPFPITKDQSTSFLLDQRHLWLRSRKLRTIMIIRNQVFVAAREWFKKGGWIEVQAPMFVSAACEGGATLFELNYFENQKAYLTQSSQLYLEALIQAFEKVFTIAPSFRAEKSRTRRHLTEFWHLEVEAAWSDLENIVKVQEELVSYIAQKVSKRMANELKFLGRDPEAIYQVIPPFERVSYDDAIEILQEKKIDVQWGDDLGTIEEKTLTMDYDKPIFIYNYPKQIKAFYHYPDPERPEIVKCDDMLAPEGYGEIIGGGQRIHDLDVLLQRLDEEGLNIEDYQWYIDLRRYGTIPHSGFGLGIERLIAWICKLDHIRDACAFPRTTTRLYP